ncbi:MAG: ATP-dependent helicase [Gaiellaceae bacterium]
MSVVPEAEYLTVLNPAQREAVLTTEGPLLVVAGAGSGKTRVLTHRVAHLVNACGVRPDEILAITFTNRAATEMVERLWDLVGGVVQTMWVMTFHAACGRVLRREAPRIGYRSGYTIYDQADQVRLVKACLEELDRDPKRFAPRGVHTQISLAKNNLVAPAEYREQVASFYDQTVADVYDLYQQRLFDSNAVDFDDMLILTVRLLEQFPDALAHWRESWRYVLVDEYQDTNRAQYRLLQLVAGEHHNVCAVGDPDQSIYAFRGADIRTILEFERDFGDVATIALEQNYRSTNRILEAANAVIEHNTERKPKLLWSELGDGEPVRVLELEDEHAEARFVVSEILRLIDEGFAGSEIAIFYRTNAQSRVLEDLLTRQEIAYRVVGGPRFYERAEIKDAVAYLSVLANPADAVSLSRVINRPRRGIGDTTVGKLRNFAAAQGISLLDAVRRADEVGLATASLRSVRAFATLCESLLAQAQELSVPELLTRVVERSGYSEALEAERTIEARGRLENLEELVSVAGEFDEREDDPTLERFLQEVALSTSADETEESESLVTLMTLHNAKGLEFRAVFITGMEEEIFPHQRSIEEQGIEEERRLFYVGVTRAQERLALTHASARSMWGGHGNHRIASRFLEELGAGIERQRLSPASWSSYGQAQVPAPRDDVPELATGDTVRHGTLGDGIVTRIEPGGVVTVRFSSDSSERRLILEYAPLEKIT